MPWKSARDLESGDVIVPRFGPDERPVESTETLTFTNQIRVKFVGGGVKRFSLAENIYVKD